MTLRSDELAVLNDLARQLTSIRDPAHLLRQVAVEARRLLGLDVAYLMLARDDGLLRIEVAEGTLGNALEGIEVPSGAGLGGLVMQSGEPLWSADYLRDGGILHLGAVDAAAASERLGGIVGVPLRVGSESIGVLFAAARRPREFADREIELLASLAGHAALALHNARLFARYERATAELTAAVALHQRLSRLAVRGGGVAETAAALGEEFGAAVTFVEGPARSAAGTGSAGSGSGAAGSAGSAGSGAIVGGSVVSAPVLVGEEHVGDLVVRGARPAAHLLETGATFVALALATERAVAEAERRASGELSAALFGTRLDEATARRRAGLAGVDLDQVRCVAVLDPADPSLAARLDGWALAHEGRSVVLLRGKDPAAVRTRLRSLTSAAQKVTAGVAACAGGPAEVRQAQRDAASCVGLLRSLGREGACALPDELGVYRSLLGQAGREDLRRFVDVTVGPLLAVPHLAETARAYLDRFRHHAATCEVLHIHPNTLYKRLRRVTEVLGEGWDGPARALEVQLALRLHGLGS
ncbi:helix-turn-helix domain-containing protein [Nonomuraea sp. NPDC050663]|uniref:helix-turn-helix domain-containing protein n=1 Tax=Nonomuraea sp. NPDC050663 TaxID=3364370 RepID=UPI00378A51C4